MCNDRNRNLSNIAVLLPNNFLPEAMACLINNNILLNSMINLRDHYAQVD